MQELISQAQAVNFDIATVVVGLGLFLFGIKAMGDQLRNIAGDRMKDLIDRYTTSHLSGIFVGALVTVVIQSSSGTTALTISLVRSGLMSLNQAIGVIMGANIGTTVTAILIGFNISAIAPYIILIGAFTYMFAQKPKQEHIAILLIAFGSLFFGLDIMGSSLSVLADMPIFSEFAIKLSTNKIAGVLLGIFMTMIIQSSSATIGIVQSLYNEGVLTLAATLPILFGDNIGTTVTAILASVGGSKEAKRAATAHVIFNMMGTTIFLIIFPFFLGFVEWGSAMLGLSNMLQIAFAHVSFNAGTTLIMYPFIDTLEKLVTKIIPISEAEKADHVETPVLELGLVKESPQVALGVSYRAVLEMSEYCKRMLNHTQSYINTGEDVYKEKTSHYEDLINKLNREISDYLIEISQYNLTEENSALLNNLLYATKDLERIGDHIENILENFIQIYEEEEQLSPEGMKDIENLFAQVDLMLDCVVTTLETPSVNGCGQIEEFELELNRLDKLSRDKFVQRLKSREHTGIVKQAVYVDILSDIERIGDHCYNVVVRFQKMFE